MIKRNIFKSILFCSFFFLNTPAFGYESLPKNLFINLAKKMNPTVVSISTESRKTYRTLKRDPFFQILEQFFGPQMPNLRPQQGLGTGFIIKKDGLIITNSHVVNGADIIRVQLSGSKKFYKAKIIGQDRRTDIALIKIKTSKDLPVAELGSSKTLQVGEWVAAFGNPYGHTHSMSKGIISALGREINELNRFPFIQTDASINPGNSGGPLVNTEGKVIGVNAAVDIRAQGIGFAIPIDDVKSIIPKLEKDGFLRRSFLGVNLENILDYRIMQKLKLPSARGVLITRVYKKSPARKAGLKIYDFITQFGNKKVSNSFDLVTAISDRAIGERVKIHFIRNGKRRSLTAILGIHPSDKKLRRRKNPLAK